MDELNRIQPVVEPVAEEDAPRYSGAVVQRAPLMAKWLWVLFWTLVTTNVLSVVCMLPVLKNVGYIVQFLGYVVYFIVLLKLKSVDERYGKAAWFCLAGGVFLVINSLRLMFATTFYSGNIEFFSLLSSALLFVSCYYEYHAHRDIVGEVDPELGKRWINVWYWKIAGIAVAVASVLIAVISVMLAAIVLLAVAVFAIVVGIIVLVALYRSAKAYRTVVEEAQ